MPKFIFKKNVALKDGRKSKTTYGYAGLHTEGPIYRTT